MGRIELNENKCEVKRLKNEIMHLKHRNELLTKMNFSLRRKIKALEEKNINLRRDYDDVVNEYFELQDVNIDLEKHNNALIQELFGSSRSQ